MQIRILLQYGDIKLLAPCSNKYRNQENNIDNRRIFRCCIFDKRLKALEAKVAQEGIILTEAQMIALERKKKKKEAYGEIETEHTGYLGAQDTYYVGSIKLYNIGAVTG